MVAKSACRLISEYAVWFGTGGDAATQLLEGALRILLSSLQNTQQGLGGGAHHAAAAFRAICIRCAPKISSDPGSLLALMDAAAAFYAPSVQVSNPAEPVPLGSEARSAIVEGLARVSASLPAAHVGEAGVRIVQPLIARAASLAQSGLD